MRNENIPTSSVVFHTISPLGAMRFSPQMLVMFAVSTGISVFLLGLGPVLALAALSCVAILMSVLARGTVIVKGDRVWVRTLVFCTFRTSLVQEVRVRQVENIPDKFPYNVMRIFPAVTMAWDAVERGPLRTDIQLAHRSWVIFFIVFPVPAFIRTVRLYLTEEDEARLVQLLLPDVATAEC